MKTLLRELLEAFGPPGFEGEVRRIVRREAASLADEVSEDSIGNLYARRRGRAGGRRIMLAAHMDEIGVIVTQVEDSGLLRFSPLGAVSRKTLLGQRLRFAGGAVGVISHNGGLKAEIGEDDIPDWPRWFIDMGVDSAGELPVGVGDVAVFLRPFLDLGERALGGGFDDRLGCAILVELLRTLGDSPHDLIFTFTVQEELGVRGARVAAFAQTPEIALAVDVTPVGDAPRQQAPLSIKLGQGPAIKVADTGMVAHPHLRRALEGTARANGIPYQPEVLTFGSTDASAMQSAGAGVISGAVSVPCRYIHTPSEMIAFSDVERTLALLKAFLSAPLEGLD